MNNIIVGSPHQQRPNNGRRYHYSRISTGKLKQEAPGVAQSMRSLSTIEIGTIVLLLIIGAMVAYITYQVTWSMDELIQMQKIHRLKS